MGMWIWGNICGSQKVNTLAESAESAEKNTLAESAEIINNQLGDDKFKYEIN